MDKGAVLKVIEEFRQALQEQGIAVSRIILYGSYATGQNREGSDIDLVVISRDFAGKGYWERIDVLTEAICKVFQPIEAVAMTPEEWDRGDSLIGTYAREGAQVYPSV